jgi:hypothetical protein
LFHGGFWNPSNKHRDSCSMKQAYTIPYSPTLQLNPHWHNVAGETDVGGDKFDFNDTVSREDVVQKTGMYYWVEREMMSVKRS